MTRSPRQAYLEKARAALAAREDWRSVFRSTTPHDAHDAVRPEPRDPIGLKCDKSDQSPAARIVDATEITWRVEAMRPRVPPTGPIPPMYARALSPQTPDGCCLSCGEPLTLGNKYNCEPCVRAAWLVLREVRGTDGPASTDGRRD